MIIETPTTLHLDLDTLAEVPSTLQALSARLAKCTTRARPHEMVEALVDVARCYADQGALQTAEAYLEQALRWSGLLGAVDAHVDLLCEVAEIAACSVEQAKTDTHVRRAARRRAFGHANEAARLSAHVADPVWEIKVLLRASDVLDRCGETAEATELQARAMMKLGSRSAN